MFEVWEHFPPRMALETPQEGGWARGHGEGAACLKLVSPLKEREDAGPSGFALN